MHFLDTSKDSRVTLVLILVFISLNSDDLDWNFSPPTYPDGYFWRGYMRNGRTGLFKPEGTVAKLAIELPSSKCNQYLSPVSFLAHSKIFSREKEKVQDKNDRKKLLISEPQGDVHHTCHVGVDGTAFGLLQVNVHSVKLSPSVGF